QQDRAGRGVLHQRPLIADQRGAGPQGGSELAGGTEGAPGGEGEADPLGAGGGQGGAGARRGGQVGPEDSAIQVEGQQLGLYLGVTTHVFRSPAPFPEKESE